MATFRRPFSQRMAGVKRLGKASKERIRRIIRRIRLFTLAPMSRVPSIKGEEERMISSAHRLSIEMVRLAEEMMRDKEKIPNLEKVDAVERQAKRECILIACDHAIQMLKLTPTEEKDVREYFVIPQLQLTQIEDNRTLHLVSTQASRALYAAIGRPRGKRLIRIYLIQAEKAEEEMNHLVHRYMAGYERLAEVLDLTRRTK